MLAASDGAAAAQNRRRHSRTQAPAIASVVRSDGTTAVWRVRDLSLGGASLIGDAPLAPGERVELTFHLPGRAPVALATRVVRRQLATRARTAVAFDAVDGGVAATLEQVVAAGAARTPETSVTELVVGRGSAGAAVLERELATAGRAVRRVESPLDAAAWLELSTPPTTLLVEEDALVFRGWKLLPHAKDTHPLVRRVVIGNAIQSFRLNLAIRSGLVDGVLEHGCAPEDAARRLGLGAR